MKEQIYSIIKQFKKKIQLLAEGKLSFAELETKSTNLDTLGEELLSFLHTLAQDMDSLHASLVALKAAVIHKVSDHKGASLREEVVIQVGKRDRTCIARHFLNTALQDSLDHLPPSIPYNQ